jgi:hypothetical protein
VFREPAAADQDQMPYATPPTFAPNGVNPQLARRVGDERLGLYAVAGSDAVCLQDEHLSNCVTPDIAAAGHMITYTLCAGVPDGKIELTGLMPDGIDHVTAVRADGSTETIRVVDNAFDAQVAHHVIAVDFTLDGHPDREPISYEKDLPACSPQTFGEHDQAEKTATQRDATPQT